MNAIGGFLAVICGALFWIHSDLQRIAKAIETERRSAQDVPHNHIDAVPA